MAASDPTAGVATPTGVLQGAAAFSWDGSTWQPSARASAGVGTPTGVLRGVAPFSWSGSAWTPGGGGPNIATPGGVLDGVAVYTWSGSAWVPAGGGPDVPTPTGTLQGVAAFYWDGAAWQPSGQAGPDVATNAGVLQGMAMFSPSGTSWAPSVSPASLDLNFLAMAPTLDPRVTFTRASTATYCNASGVMQTAATNAPRFGYDPVTLAARGLLIEEARTNLWLQSADATNAAWQGGGIGAPGPTMTANQAVAPDGTQTAARAAFPAITSGTNTQSGFIQNITATANPFTFSIWMKGAVGGEQIAVCATPDAATWYRTIATLTTSWQRFSLTTPNLTAATWYFEVGTDLRDGAQTSKPAQTINLWGGQVEQGAFVTSYIPTAAAAVTRAADVATIASISGRNTTAESFAADVLLVTSQEATPRIVGDTASTRAPIFMQNSTLTAGSNDSVAAALTANVLTIGSVAKIATTWATPNAGTACMNAGAVATIAAQTAGFSVVTSFKFGGDSSATDQMNGYMRRFRYWPRVLANTEMQQVTT